MESARRRYSQLAEEQRRGPTRDLLVDALAGQALMAAALRERAEAERLLADVRSIPDRQAWLPWRQSTCLDQSIALALEGAWTPGHDEAYPPSIAPR